MRLLRALGQHLEPQHDSQQAERQQSAEAAAAAGEWQEKPAATTRLYHGTSFEAAISIQQGGFRVDLAGTNAGARLGPGVYCSTTLKKALSYAGGHAGEGIIFVMDVALGRCADAS